MENKRIVYQNADGGVSIIIPAPGATQEDVLKAVPFGAAYEIVDVADVPNDRTFRNAWFHDTSPEPQKIGVDVAKAKDITHDLRRAKRAEEFKPLDIQATIPAMATQAEAERQAIRDKYAAMQIEINGCTCPTDLKAIIDREGL